MSPGPQANPRAPGGGAGPVVLGLAALAAAALLNQLVTRRVERRHPPSGRFLTIDGTRLHYVDRGAGSPVVLLHGNGAMTEDFGSSGIIDRLATKYRVIAFDRPGFGHSARPRSVPWTASAQAGILRKALRALGVDRPVVVGHSWGALAALALALEDPGGTAALVLLSGYYFPRLRGELIPPSVFAVPVLGDILNHTVAPLIGRILLPALVRRIFAPSPVSAGFRAFTPLAMSLRPSQIRASAADTALMIPSAAALLPRHGTLTMPVVIVAGTGDRIVDTNRQSRRLHRHLPESDLRLIDGAGHMIHHIAPAEVAAAIEDAARAAGIRAGAPPPGSGA